MGAPRTPPAETGSRNCPQRSSVTTRPSAAADCHVAWAAGRFKATRSLQHKHLQLRITGLEDFPCTCTPRVNASQNVRLRLPAHTAAEKVGFPRQGRTLTRCYRHTLPNVCVDAETEQELEAKASLLHMQQQNESQGDCQGPRNGSQQPGCLAFQRGFPARKAAHNPISSFPHRPWCGGLACAARSPAPAADHLGSTLALGKSINLFRPQFLQLLNEEHKIVFTT